MIIACPACATRYEVPESAIGADGRTVRCAKCRHSWLAVAGEDVIEEELEAEEAEQPEGDQGSIEADQEEGFDHEEAPATAGSIERQAPAGTGAEPPQTEAAADVAGHTRPVARPVRRRGRLRLLAWAAVIFAILAAGTIAAASYWGLPAWMPIQRESFAAVQPGLKLDFPAERQERRQLPNGTEFFGASGTITNLDDQALKVPPILIVLRDGRDRIVYSWEVAPPKRSLAPGESITVREAITDVPRSARVAEIGWKPV